MAVTQSLGDGFTLYNGVKLPNILSKSGFNYSLVSKSGSMTLLALCNKPLVKNINDEYYTCENSFSLYAYKLVNSTTWKTYGSVSNANAGTAQNLRTPLWSNYDIFTTDGTLYHSSTSPIPLDGMQVIEWDGDTSGLTAHPSKANYYKAATGSVDSATAQAVLSDGTTSADGYLSEGGNIYLYSDGTKYTSLLAYTEAVAPKWQFNLRDFLSGVAAAAASRGVLKRVPNAYLYNGVQLPPLPEVGYPYKVIAYLDVAQLYRVYYCLEKCTVTGATVSFKAPYVWYSFSGDTWEYMGEETSDSTPNIAMVTPIWANHDILQGDTAYLEASKPVPVYE